MATAQKRSTAAPKKTAPSKPSAGKRILASSRSARKMVRASLPPTTTQVVETIDSVAGIMGIPASVITAPMRTIIPQHPGALIRAERKKRKLSGKQLAEVLGVALSSLLAVEKGTSVISPAMAYRLGIAFGNGAFYWSMLQSVYDLHTVHNDFGDRIIPTVSMLPLI